MWAADQITIDIEDIEYAVGNDRAVTVLVRITTPVGVLRILGALYVHNDVLHIDGAHAGGLNAGVLGRSGLNAIGRKLLEVADVKEILIQGSTRTTGRNAGKVPRPIR
jgi:hypothetical protein